MKKVAFVFPGQGSQYVGMGEDLCSTNSLAKQTFEEASDVLGFDIKKLCFEGNIEDLTKTENAQPAILTASIAAFRVYKSEYGFLPQVLAGHSLGEISALTCANAIRFGDAVKIVRQRGRFMQEAANLGVGAMSAISKVDRSTIDDICKELSGDGNIVVISNYNSPYQTVISGHKRAVYDAGEKLRQLGANITQLKVSAPFHSPLMKEAADRFESELRKYTYNDMEFPVISNTDARLYESKEKIIDKLIKQITMPVRWEESMAYIKNMGIELVVEIGPGTILRNLMKKNQPSIVALSFDKNEDSSQLKIELSPKKPQAINNGFKHTVVTKCIAITVCTRNRNWDNDEYQRGVVEPYRKVQKVQEEIEKAGREPTLEEMKQALDMLKSMFFTKRVPLNEQIDRFNEVFDETGTRDLFHDYQMPG